MAANGGCSRNSALRRDMEIRRLFTLRLYEQLPGGIAGWGCKRILCCPAIAVIQAWRRYEVLNGQFYGTGCICKSNYV